MKERPNWKQIYTDAPELHSIFYGLFQVMGWIFFHPSAWRNHVASVDATLTPSLPLSELSFAHLRNPRLRVQLLVVVLPLLAPVVGTLVGYVAHSYGLAALAGALEFALVAWALGVSSAMALRGGMYFAGLVLTFIVGPYSVYVVGGDVGYVPLGFGIGLCLMITGSTGRWTPRKIDSRLIWAALLGLLAAITFRGVIVAPMLYRYREPALWGPVSLPAGGERAIRVGGSSGWFAMLAFALSMLTISSRRRAAVAGLAFGGVIGISTYLWGLVGGLWIHVTIEALAIAPPMVGFLAASRLSGPRAGVAAAALASIGQWSSQWLLAHVLGVDSHLDDHLFSTGGALLVFGCLLGLSFNYWRPVLLYPFLAAWNATLFWLDERTPQDELSYLSLHSAFWDEHQFLPLRGLDEHVVLIYERRPDEGEAVLNYLSNSRQRWAAKAAQIELDVRRLERCASVEDIAANATPVFGASDEPGAFQRTFERIAQDFAAALAQANPYLQRLSLAPPRDRLDPLIRELTKSDAPLAVRFRAVARRWTELLDERVERLAAEAEASQEIESPYVLGVPLTEAQEIFTGRTDVCAEIEQALLDKRQPPLLLYGQRRMGKTSLLNNLGRVLRSDFVPLFVDLQGPATRASDHAGLLYNLARDAIASAKRHRDVALPPLSRESLDRDPFTRFDEWLDEVEQVLGTRTAILMLDEFEVLDAAFAKKRFDDAEVLGMLRNLIQHRRRLKILLAGSHDLDELTRWSSYLINVRTVHLDDLAEADARKLIEAPVPGFKLRYEPDASARVLAVTRRHPFLVQLLCDEIVAHKNAQAPDARRLARLADVDASIPPALEHGAMYFGDVEVNQAGEAGTRLLRRLAAEGEEATMAEAALAEGAEGDVGAVVRALVRREIVERVEGGVRFRNELVRRWFASTRRECGHGYR